MGADSPDVVIAKRLLDQLKQRGFQFERIAPGEDGPLIATRVTGDCVDMIQYRGIQSRLLCLASAEFIANPSRGRIGGASSGWQCTRCAQ